MTKIMLLVTITLLLSTVSGVMALEKPALIGVWQLVENAKDSEGNESPFVSNQIFFSADGTMESENMPVAFHYKINPDKTELENALARNPELKGMDIMLIIVGESPQDWSRPTIVYGVELKKDLLSLKISGYTPARYKKLK